MKLPFIKFSPWFHWSERNKIENSNYPGVYMLAKFNRVPSGNADPFNWNIIYFGETCRSLNGRWYQFNRSAFQNKGGHSGGHSYRKTYGDKVRDLYVAALPVINELEDVKDLFIRYAERKLILDYALKRGKQPILNHR